LLEVVPHLHEVYLDFRATLTAEEAERLAREQFALQDHLYSLALPIDVDNDVAFPWGCKPPG
jgi:hypothetical protein